MKSIVFFLCVFAVLSAGFVSVVHAHTATQEGGFSIEVSTDDTTEASTSFDTVCDMHCHMSYEAVYQAPVLGVAYKQSFMLLSGLKSPFVSGLKRPPKS